MASLKTTMTGNLGAQREAEGSKFFKREIKRAGQGPGPSPLTPMSKPQLAQTGACCGSLPPGANTVGGVVGGLSDKGNYQGVKAGRG